MKTYINRWYGHDVYDKNLSVGKHTPSHPLFIADAATKREFEFEFEFPGTFISYKIHISLVLD